MRIRMRLGIDFGGTNFKSGVFSENGEIISFSETKLSDLTKSGDLLDNILLHTKDFVRDLGVEKGGFATKGLVDMDEGKIVDDIGAGALLAGKNLREEFSNYLGIPFIIENDTRAYAWGEWKFGAGKGSSVMVCMTLGTGVGCSLVLNGRPYEGSDPLGGLLGGHISINKNGPKCSCGSRGCLELYCSAPALYKIIHKVHPELRKEEDLLPTYFNLVREQGKPYSMILRKFQENLAIGIVNVIHAYGPDTVVIGGGIMNSADVILPGLIKLVDKMAWTYPRGKVKILQSRLGNKAATIGVAFHPKLG